MSGASPAPDLDVLVVADAHARLDENEQSSHGVWLMLAKKGATAATSLTYAEALDEASR